MFTRNELTNISMTFSNLSDKINKQCEQITQLKLQIKKLQEDIEELQNSKFTLEKIKNDDSAIKFYTGFPNYSSLLAVLEYFEPKFQHVHYWQGSSSTKKK